MQGFSASLVCHYICKRCSDMDMQVGSNFASAQQPIRVLVWPAKARHGNAHLCSTSSGVSQHTDCVYALQRSQLSTLPAV